VRSAPLRRYASLVLVLALIVGGGLVGVVTARAATDRAVEVRRADRDAFRSVVAKLMVGYLQMTLASLNDQATRDQDTPNSFTMRPDSKQDAVRLRRMVDGSLFFRQGAVLTDLSGRPLTSYAPAGPLPPITDSGYTPLIASLRQGQPGLSSVMTVDDREMVAFAVPVVRNRVPRGLLIGYMRFDADGPSKQFLEAAPLPERARLMVVDTTGTIAASNRPALVGTPTPALKAFRAATAGRSGLLEEDQDGVEYVSAYAPMGLSGWTVVVEEPTADFLGPIQAGGTRVQLALLMVLIAAAGTVSVLHHRRQMALQQLAEQALRDPLTDLPNRILFQSRLDAVATPPADGGGDAVALLFCDLDGFKQVNDGYGHEAGDRLLMIVAQRLRDSVREDDLVARIGGDEFTILLSSRQTSAAELAERAADVANRIGAALADPVDLGLGRPPVRIGVSIGISVLDPENHPADALLGRPCGPSLLRSADEAMYSAKARGGGSQFATV
jgi:diguanylate cyclase (GGDEF)-like protein